MSLSAPQPPSSPPSRLESIDQFRGFAILLMVLANYAADVETLPAALKHAPDVGLTVIDLVAPLFIFAIGLTFGLSMRRRIQRQGPQAAYAHFIRRALAILGIGCLISSGEIILGYNPSGVNWGVLQAIGAAILLALPVIRAPAWIKLGGGLALLAGYQLLLDRFWLPLVLNAPHGGLPGALGWGAMLALAAALADLFHDVPRGRRLYPWATLLALVLGVALSPLVPISKHRVSASYVLISLGASGLCFWAFHLLVTRGNLRSRVLAAWGRNPLLLYVFHYLLLGLIVLPGIPTWHAQAPLWLVFLQASGLLIALSWAGLYLEKKGWHFSL